MPPKRHAVTADNGQAKKEKKEESETGSESGSESGSASESEDEDEDGNSPEPKGDVLATINALSNADSASTSTPAVPRSTLAMRKNDKANMVFPDPFQKGTFVIRLSDLDKPEMNWLWRIDNHQLLQKYFVIAGHPENEGSRQWYEKSNRYTGWFCTEKWKFLEVKVIKREGKDEKIKVVYPSEEKRARAKKECDDEEKKHEENDD